MLFRSTAVQVSYTANVDSTVTLNDIEINAAGLGIDVDHTAGAGTTAILDMTRVSTTSADNRALDILADGVGIGLGLALGLWTWPGVAPGNGRTAA